MFGFRKKAYFNLNKINYSKHKTYKKMKNLIKSLFIVVLMISTSTFAQKSSIDSPHNYKRPVFQQRKALAESNAITAPIQANYQIQNNIRSAHNYKRQGTVDFVSESILVFSVSAKPEITMNPVLSSNHYKGHFQSTLYGKQVASKNAGLRMVTVNNVQKDDTLSEIN